MITDKTIDVATARFWCMFSDKEFIKILDQNKTELAGKSKSNGKELNEAFGIENFMYWTSIFFTLSAVAGLLTPYIKNIWSKVMNGKEILAKTTFTADDTDYECIFDLKKMKWILTGKTSITPQETMMFFETQFFQVFNQKCSQYIEAFFQQKDNIKKSIDQVKDSKTKNLLNIIINKEREIRMNMFNAKYLT